MLNLKLEANGPTLMKTWRLLENVPGGRLIFSRMVGRMAPYTGTIDARVLELSPGYARVEMRDRRAVRNHLDSVHAVALVNLAEETTGLALVSSLPADGRGILKGLSIDYIKKGRGLLTAACTCPEVECAETRVYEIEGEIRDADGDVVARAQARWQVGPRRR